MLEYWSLPVFSEAENPRLFEVKTKPWSKPLSGRGTGCRNFWRSSTSLWTSSLNFAKTLPSEQALRAVNQLNSDMGSRTGTLWLRPAFLLALVRSFLFGEHFVQIRLRDAYHLPQGILKDRRVGQRFLWVSHLLSL